MPEKSKHAEQRSKTGQRELIEITEELRAEMEEKKRETECEEKRYETEVKQSEEGYNFREYDQRQDFFVTVSKVRFLETVHPAAEFLLVRIATNLGKIIRFKTDELLALCPG